MFKPLRGLSTIGNWELLLMAASAAAVTACNKLTPLYISRSSFSRNFSHLYLTRKNSILPQLTHATPARRRLSVNCRRADRDGDSSGEEPPESLFMKELKRRGMTPASLLEEDDKIPYGLGNKETKTREEGSDTFENRKDRGSFTGSNDWGQFNQRARSMALNSEGLEGLIPRAKVLLTLGATFFFFFWPLILTTVAFFSAVYIYFGPTFIHAGNKQVAAPTYIDPYKLLEDEERLTQSILPRAPFTSSQ